MSRWRLLTGTSTGSQIVPPGVVHVRAGVGQLHEVAEVLDRAVAPAVVQVAHEGRAVVRGEDGVRARRSATLLLRVAGVLGELARRASPGRSGGTSRAGSGPARPGRRRRPSAEQARARRDRPGTRGRPPGGSCRRCARSGPAPPRSGPRTGRACGSGTAVRSIWLCGPERLAAGPATAPLAGAVVHHGPPCRPRRATRRRRWAAPRVGRAGAGIGPGRQVDDPGQVGSIAAVRWGNASASTKCSWKRGSTAVSIFSTGSHDGLDLAPGACPTGGRSGRRCRRRCRPSRTLARSQSGIEAEDHRVDAGRSGCRTRPPGGSRRRCPPRRGPSAGGRRRTGRPWPAGWPGRRSG